MIQNDITTLLGLASFIGAICQYFDSRKREQNLKEFENYHKLIKELVQPDDEKRHFKRYFLFSLRTLKGLKNEWGKVDGQHPRLLEELDLTIDFLQRRIEHGTIFTRLWRIIGLE